MERDKKLLLHGVLHASIYEIDKLHFGFGRFSRARQGAGTRASAVAGTRASAGGGAGAGACGCSKQLGKDLLYQIKSIFSCDPKLLGYKLYATIDLDKARVGRTRIVNQPSHPRWFEDFSIYCGHQVSDIIFTVKDENPVGATLIGRAYIPATDIINGRAVNRWVDILDENHEPIRSKIHVKLQFFDVTRHNNWSRGIMSPQFRGVPRTFFKQRQGCKVSLYQDAHVLDNFVPEVELGGGNLYRPKRCWVDVFDAISKAKYLIYIAGWSVYTEITLIRDPTDVNGITLGELLKKKADEGVRVLLLVWDDRTSVEVFKRDGLMGTHDQETADYFRNTKVRCFLCPRNPDGGKTVIQGFQIGTMFTHHQKTIVVDSDPPQSPTPATAVPAPAGGAGIVSSLRVITSFVGGIDLCNGRYDDQHHSLFRTLNTVHRNDFHQPNFPGSSIKKGGPREPWHDIHCRLEGPVAWDVLYNFEQRWKKQVGNKFIFTMDELDNFLTRPSEAAMFFSPQDPDTWNVQIFRSIDGGAALGFPNKPEEAAHVGLVSGKDSIIDRSIQDAYIDAIRRAKNFIYIENQYFIGSSFGWKPTEKGVKLDDIGALNLIPKEISLKIVSKIKAGESFCVYVVIPMWPEGVPESGSVQAILDWQKRTMEMMYTDIADAIKEKGIAKHPKDYLSFFCLANRETVSADEFVPSEKPEPADSDYARAQRNRRFMIYVHAKMMIVDDEYIIIGSANINQRSMEGSRDTEIAMGAYQPYHISTMKEPATGEIYGFRMALWSEHLQLEMHPDFLYPQTEDCIKRINKIAAYSWKLYSEELFSHDLPGHLLSYPVEVTSLGQVLPLPEFDMFPDTKAPVLGRESEILPPILTT